MATHLIYDPVFIKHDTWHPPENALRLEVILHCVENDEQLCKKLVRDAPRRASDEDITRCHREDLITHIQSAVEHGEHYLDVDTRISPESFEVARLAAGAALVAVDAAM